MYIFVKEIYMYTDVYIKVGFKAVPLDGDSVKGKGVQLYSSSCMRNSEGPDLILCQYSASLQVAF